MLAGLYQPLLLISDVTLKSCVSKTGGESGAEIELTHFIYTHAHKSAPLVYIYTHTPLGIVFFVFLNTAYGGCDSLLMPDVYLHLPIFSAALRVF